MSSYWTSAADITIANGTQNSNALNAREHYPGVIAIALYGPAALDAHTFIIQSAKDPNEAAPTFVKHRHGDPSGLVDAAPPGAGESQVYFDLPALGQFRIRDTTGNVAAARTWQVSALIGTR